MNKKQFLTNTKWIILGKIFQMSISLIIGMITARYLGPSNFGIINYTSSFIAFFTSICTLGLNGIIVKEIMDNPDIEGTILGTSIGMRILSSILSSISILFIINIINSGDEQFLIVGSLQVISLLFQSFDMINYWYQAKLMSKYSAIIQSVGYLAVTIYRIILLIQGKSVEWFAFCTSLDMIVNSILLLVSYYKNGGQKLTFSFDKAKYMLNNSYHFILSGLMVSVYGQMDKIMIGQMISTKEVGFYSTATAISGMWTFILLAIIDSSRPIIIDAKNQNDSLYETRIKQLYSVIIWLSLIVSILITIFARPIVTILYGEDFIGTIRPLQIVTWSTLFSYLGVARGIWIVCESKQKYIKYLTFSGAISNLILNLILIPTLGISGAALATLITQIITNFIMPLLISDIRINSIYIIDAFLLKGLIDKKYIVNKRINKKQYM